MRKKAPEGRVNWTDKTFERLRDAAPETLTSQFQVTTTMVLNLMERAGDPVAAMAGLLERAHEPEAQRRRHVRRALEIYLSLRTAGGPDTCLQRPGRRRRAPPAPAGRGPAGRLRPPTTPPGTLRPGGHGPAERGAPEHTVDVVSVVEATLDDPRPLLYAQQRAARGEAIAA